MEDNNLFNFIVTLYICFLFIYWTAPVPRILYKKVYLKKCNEKTDTVCINHFPVEEFHSHR